MSHAFLFFPSRLLKFTHDCLDHIYIHISFTNCLIFAQKAKIQHISYYNHKLYLYKIRYFHHIDVF